MKTKFSDYLERHYLDWQIENGRASIRKYSLWLGINSSLVIQWMNGNGKPGSKNLAKLAIKLGPDIYDVLEIPPPPEFIRKLEAIYDDLSIDQQQQLQKQIAEILDDYIKSNE